MYQWTTHQIKLTILYNRMDLNKLYLYIIHLEEV